MFCSPWKTWRKFWEKKKHIVTPSSEGLSCLRILTILYRPWPPFIAPLLRSPPSLPLTIPHHTPLVTCEDVLIKVTMSLKGILSWLRPELSIISGRNSTPRSSWYVVNNIIVGITLASLRCCMVSDPQASEDNRRLHRVFFFYIFRILTTQIFRL